MSTDLWDDPEIDDVESEMTEEEMLAIESGELFTLVDDYAEELFGMAPVYDEEGPFGWDITDTIDWTSLDYEGPDV